MTFTVLSRQRAEALTPPEEPYIIISITDPGSEEAILPETEFCKGICRAQFHDAEIHDTTFLGTPLVPMSDEQSKQIWDFFHSHRDVEHVFVHCEAGISRSAGTAAGLAVANGMSDAFIFSNPRFCPNMRCYRHMLCAAADAGQLIERERESE